MIGIIDCDIGNIGSIANILRLLKEPFKLVDKASEFDGCERLIFPGVGAFDAAVRRLESKGLRDALVNQVENKHLPILGICVGAQLFCQSSEEGKLPGLGWIDTKVIAFNPAMVPYVPHLGWNKVKAKVDDPLLSDVLGEFSRFYFLHSYYIELCQASIGTAEFGQVFTAAFRRNNIWGVQFHPEKSHRYGIGLLKNFCEIACVQE